MTNYLKHSVGGERAIDVVEALSALESGPVRAGMVRCDGVVGPAAVRALMRIEAEFLLADADAPPSSPHFQRTETQRRADAFVEMFERLRPPGRS